VSHTYAAAGSYSVTLTVTDNGGSAGTRSGTVSVSPIFMYVADLDRTSTGGGNTWTATVTITIRDVSPSTVADALVNGTWSTGGSASCTTNASGQCTVSMPGIPRKTQSLTFTVVSVTHATRTYNATMNQDPDGDSTGTSIVVIRP